MRSELGCLRIRTPEGISFSYQLAGPVSRMLAWVVDISCIFGACAIAAKVLPGAEERLVREQVAETRNARLVHEERLDRRPARTHLGPQHGQAQ